MLQLPVVALGQSKTSAWGEASRYAAFVLTNDVELASVYWFIDTV